LSAKRNVSTNASNDDDGNIWMIDPMTSYSSQNDNVDIQMNSSNEIDVVGSRNATEATTSRITTPKTTTASNKSPHVPTSKRSLENKIIKTRREGVISKQQKLQHDNTESSKKAGMRKRNGLSNEASSAKKCNRCDKNFCCTECGLNFKSNQSLKIHRELANADQKYFRCDECHFSTNNFGYLQAHVDGIHKGVFKYKCGFCKFVTNVKGALNTHTKIKHDKLYAHKCNQCVYSTGIVAKFTFVFENTLMDTVHMCLKISKIVRAEMALVATKIFLISIS
jgi:hypothetical protein